MRDKTVVMARRPSSVGGGAIVVTCAASAPRQGAVDDQRAVLGDAFSGA
jgi:hypothetical protein